MKDLALTVVKELADHPEKVQLTSEDGDRSVTLKLTVAEEDKGKVIGKQGKVIKAVRALLSAAGAKSGQRVVLDLD
jgi:predicted RNA-binding protein YlqC (UPF0109 family)